MRNTITRTITSTICTCLFYIEDSVRRLTVKVPNGISTTDQADRFIRKNIGMNGNLICVESVEKKRALYGMPESVFIKNAVEVPSRSKDTRKSITKSVNILIGELLYMDKDYKLNRMPVQIPREYANKLDKYALMISPVETHRVLIENVKEENKLFAMSEEDFKRLAHEMIDHQHYKDQLE